MDAANEKFPPPPVAHGFLRIGRHLIDCGALRVISRDPPVRMPPKALAVLIELARHTGKTVSRDDLLDTVWPDTAPTPDVVKQAILEIRRALDGEGDAQGVVETIPRVGYRLLVPATFHVDHPDREEPPVIASDAEPLASPPAPAARRWTVPAALAILAAALAAAWWWRPSDPGPQATGPAKLAGKSAAVIVPYRLITSDLGSEGLPAVSPDGLQIAYAAFGEPGHASRIALRGSDGSGPTWWSTDPEVSEWFPVWSRDGAELAFQRSDPRTGQCAILARSLLGRDERHLGPCWPQTLRYFDWSPDGRRLALSDRARAQNPGGQMQSVELATGEVGILDYPAGEVPVDFEPKYSPDGRWLAFRRGGQPITDLYLLDLASKQVRALTHFGASLRGFDWLPSGRGLIVSSNHAGLYSLYRLDIEDGRVEALGIADAIEPDVAAKAPVLAFVKLRQVRRIVAVALDRDPPQPVEPLAASTGSEREPALAPDGARLAFVSDRSGGDQVWLVGTQGDATPLRVTSFSGERLSALTWLPGGERLWVVAAREGQSRLVEIDVNRRSQAEVGVDGLQVRQAVPARNGHAWMTARRGDGAWVLHRGVAGARGWLWQDTGIAASEVQYSAPLDRLVLRRTPVAPLERRDGALQLVPAQDPAPTPSSTRMDGVMDYRVRGSTLWLLAWQQGRFFLVRRELGEPATRAKTRELPFRLDWGGAAFDVSAATGEAWITRVERDDSDIALADLPDAMR